MKVKYFPDTDTALIEFVDREVHETKEISENVYIDVDKDGNLVNITIEHAKATAALNKKTKSPSHICSAGVVCGNRKTDVPEVR